MTLSWHFLFTLYSVVTNNMAKRLKSAYQRWKQSSHFSLYFLKFHLSLFIYFLSNSLPFKPFLFDRQRPNFHFIEWILNNTKQYLSFFIFCNTKCLMRYHLNLPSSKTGAQLIAIVPWLCNLCKYLSFGFITDGSCIIS